MLPAYHPSRFDPKAVTPQRVLVTGGAGFIGSHVVEVLLRAGVPVTVLDDLSSGSRDNLPIDPQVRFVHGDVGDVAAIGEAMVDCGRVVHLAAVASVQRSLEDPDGTHRVNYEATIRLLEEARARKVERFVYASSAAVYGDAQTPPVDERGELAPLTPYAQDKLASERALSAYREDHALSAVSLRFFNVYGPRQRSDSPYSGVISLFLRHALNGRLVTVFGDGGQTRDFVYVVDVARVVVDMALRPKLPVEPVINVGRAEGTSVLELVDAIEAVFGMPLQRRFEPARPGEVRYSSAGVERLQAALGWLPTTDLDNGLRRCIEATGLRNVATTTSCTDAPRQRAFCD